MPFEDVQPIDVDDVSFTPIKATTDNCYELEFKELVASTDFFIFPSASGSQSDGTGERIPAGQPKVFRPQRSSGSFKGTLSPAQILGYAQTLSGAGTKKFIRISKP
jgi:hypothetical protein